MSEEIKTLSKEELFILDLKCSTEPTLTEKGRNLLLNYIEDLQQKVEQLEKENKELRQPQVFIDCEDMEERYGRDLYEDYLKGKIEQLENIRKEAIKKIDKNSFEKEEFGCWFRVFKTDLQGIAQDLLNILNKGSE